jgi:hypothetical protein
VRGSHIADLFTRFIAATVGSPPADARKIGELHNRSLRERLLQTYGGQLHSPSPSLIPGLISYSFLISREMLFAHERPLCANSGPFRGLTYFIIVVTPRMAYSRAPSSRVMLWMGFLPRPR